MNEYSYKFLAYVDAEKVRSAAQGIRVGFDWYLSPHGFDAWHNAAAALCEIAEAAEKYQLRMNAHAQPK